VAKKAGKLILSIDYASKQAFVDDARQTSQIIRGFGHF
jgi:hypothetical protein